MGTCVSGLIDLMESMADLITETVTAEVPEHDVQVQPFMVVNPTPPCVDIYPGDPSRDEPSAAFHELGGGYLFTVRARVHTADVEAGQRLLLRFMDDEDSLSIAGALSRDRKLGGLAFSTDVQAVTGYLLFPAVNNEGALLGAQWTVLVLPVPAPIPAPVS